MRQMYSHDGENERINPACFVELDRGVSRDFFV